MTQFDQILEELRRKRAALELELDRVRKAIELTEKARVAVQADAPLESGRASQSDSLSPSDVATAVREVLEARGVPMRRGAIVAELLRRGLKLQGKDINKNVGTIIWRHPQMFVSLDKLGYWLRDRPISGVYDPKKQG